MKKEKSFTEKAMNILFKKEGRVKSEEVEKNKDASIAAKINWSNKKKKGQEAAYGKYKK